MDRELSKVVKDLMKLTAVAFEIEVKKMKEPLREWVGVCRNELLSAKSTPRHGKGENSSLTYS